MDPDHTVALYDCSTGAIIGSAKGIRYPNNVFDIAYSENGNEIVVVGIKQIKFFSDLNSSKRALECSNGKIGKLGKKRTYFCVAYFGNNAVVGCAGGALYMFKGDRCVQVIQAHGLNESILSIYYNSDESILVTGGKDGVVKCWDASLKEV
jgi:WD40 repeat protein